MPEYEVVLATPVLEYLRELPTEEMHAIVKCLYRELPLKDDQVTYHPGPENYRERPLEAGYVARYRPLKSAERTRCKIRNGGDAYFLAELVPVWKNYPG